MDLSKYFDTLNHELRMNLLRKDMGIQSYLSAAPAGAAFFCVRFGYNQSSNSPM